MLQVGGETLVVERAVVIKALDGVSAAGLVRLQREGQPMAAPAHPSIAQVHGLETWRGRPLLVMEHLDGGTLAARVASGPRPPAEAVRVTASVAEALDALHASGYRHGDVKPSNIGFALSRAAELLDFGLAERTGRDRPLAGVQLGGQLIQCRARGRRPPRVQQVGTRALSVRELRFRDRHLRPPHCRAVAEGPPRPGQGQPAAGAVGAARRERELMGRRPTSALTRRQMLWTLARLGRVPM